MLNLERVVLKRDGIELFEIIPDGGLYLLVVARVYVKSPARFLDNGGIRCGAPDNIPLI